MEWHYNVLILEKILSNLDLSDLKSASLVCKAWLEASVKAFEATSRIVVSDPPQPDNGLLDLAHVLQRFHHRHKSLKFKLGGGGEAGPPVGLLADLPLQVSSRMTNLIIDYEPTAQVLKSINVFLSQLTTKFPALEELHICPKADPPEDSLVSRPWAEALENISVADYGEHLNLKILRVPVVGPNSAGYGIKWGFLASLKKLEQLDLLKLHVEGDDWHLPLGEFLRCFPAGVQVSKLKIHLTTGSRLRDITQAERRILNSFRALNPETCTFIIEQVDGEIGLYYTIVGSLLSARLKRIETHCSMPLSCFRVKDGATCHVFELVAGVRHYRVPEHNARVLLHIDIYSEVASPPASFAEMESAHFKAPFVLRLGPVEDQDRKHFQWFFKRVLNRWSSQVREHNWPVPNYNSMRKYTFDQSGAIVEQEQFYPGEKSTLDRVLPPVGGIFPVARSNGPVHRVWRKIEFPSFPHSSTIVASAEPSWKERLKDAGGSYVKLMPASELIIYSID